MGSSAISQLNIGTMLDAKTRALLDKMRSGGELSPHEALSAMRLSEAADDRYLTLQEQGAPAEVWEKWFSLARLLRGIAVGFGAAHREDIADAIYEIAKSVDNSARLFEQHSIRNRCVAGNQVTRVCVAHAGVAALGAPPLAPGEQMANSAHPCLNLTRLVPYFASRHQCKKVIV
jgi:hypothetical protein